MGMSIWMRVRYVVFAIADRLLGTRLIDREKARLRHHLELFEDQTVALREQMEDLNQLLHVVQVQLCVLYLRQRHMLRPETWLSFAPAESADEERDLDLLIGRLVRYGLSTVRTQRTLPEHSKLMIHFRMSTVRTRSRRRRSTSIDSLCATSRTRSSAFSMPVPASDTL